MIFLRNIHSANLLMAFRECLLVVVISHAVVCYTPKIIYGPEDGDAATISFLPQESGLFVHPFGPRKQRNDSYQELTFVSFPESRGVLAGHGPLHDFAPLPIDDSGNSSKSSVDFYEVKGHVIKKEVTPDFPFIQVLFHGRTITHDMSPTSGGSKLCVEMVAIKDGDITTSFCQVDEQTGVCLANITVPERWWSSFLSSPSSSSSSSSSPLPREDTVEMSYVAYTQSTKCPRASPESNLSSLMMISPRRGSTDGSLSRKLKLEGSFARLPRVELVGSESDVLYEMNARNSEVLVYTPKTPVFPGRRFRVMVKLRTNSSLKKFSIKAKTKSGLRILGIETHPPWQTDLEVSSKRQVAEVVAFNTGTDHGEQALAVFDWLLEVDLYPLKVTFTMDYTNVIGQGSESPDESERRMNIRIKVANDAVEKLIPVLESQELINTAPITGQPQSFGLTILAVSGNHVDDVTERSHCFSSDDTVLQVSEICGAYFTRGTETKGSTRVMIMIRYKGQEVMVPIKVWMLETPLQVEVSDSKLSLMAGWKVPLFDPGSFSKKDSSRMGTSPRTPLSCQSRFQSTTVDVYARLVAMEPSVVVPPSSVHSRVTMTTASTSSSPPLLHRHGGSSKPSETNAMLDLSHGSESPSDRKGERSKPHSSRIDSGGGGVEKTVEGHVTYLLHRKASFKVTHLLRNCIRSSDGSVVEVDFTRKDGSIVAHGLKPGKSEIQVVSHAGNVIGIRDIRVSMDKVTLDHVKGHATSDLRLEVAPSQDFPGAWVAKVHRATTMARRYQESPLEITVGFDDDTSLPLKFVDAVDYTISVESLDNGVVEVAKSDFEFPKIVARGSGAGDLVSLALGPSKFCPTPRPRPLATGHVFVDVIIPHDDLLTQNDAGHFFGFPSRDIIELDVETVKKNSKFDKPRQKSHKFSKGDPDIGKPTPSRTKSNEGGSHQEVHLEPLPSQLSLSSSSSTIVHITMYVLLGIFGLALAIFVVNCFFYVANSNSRKSKMNNIFVGKNTTIKEVQDWIWIDKKTLERNAVNTKCTRVLMSPDEFSRASKASSNGSSNGECRLSSATDFSSEVSCLSSSAGGGKGVGLYRGSECSVRICGSAMPPDDNGNTLPHDHHSLKCNAAGGVGGSCKQLHSGKSLPEQIQADSDVEMTESFRCVPLDAQLEKQQQTLIDKTSVEPPDSSVVWKDEKLGLSYEQLMKYFSNLKESDA